ncbi:MAG TPA: hypothetical protein P5556_01245 [Candidatus Gastranaerophilales bacterium]|nr:hypothetical protein [Candidatus Gastranaerophilales bacterium]
MFFVALFLASPVAYISAWGWMYNEALIWGFAWVISYISVYLLWTFKPQTEINAKNGALMGLCLSMAVLSRAIDAIIPLFSFVFIVFKAFFDYFFKKNPALLKSLLPGIFLCFIFCGFALKINFEKWGNPLVFQQFEKNIQVIQNPERLDGYKKYGLWNFNRLPTSFLYYFVPSAENFKPQFPFIDVDRELTIMKNRSYYDLIMASRVPLSLSSLYLLFFALIGAYKLLKLDKKAIIYLIPLLLSGILQYTTMLIYGGLALRYSLGFIFLIVILNLIFLFLESQKQKFLGKSIVLYYSVILLFISIYINFYTMLAYKHSIPNISPNTRYFLGKIINYIPDENHLRFIKNNTLYEKIKPVTIIETKKRD